VDLNTGNPVWSQEMYSPFLYFSPTKFFHTLETDETVVGFSFAEEAEALSFFQTVMIRARDMGLIPADHKKKLGNKGTIQMNKFVDKISSKMPAVVVPKAPHVSFKPISESISHTGGRMKKMMNNLKKKEDSVGEDVAFEISSPQNFKHESHLEWSPGQPIDPNNLPPEWKKLFQAAGVRKKDLLNPETADVVMGIVSQAMGGNPHSENTTPMAAPPPPPPPPPSGGPPPPRPPPNNNTNSISASSGGNLLNEIASKTLKKVDAVGPIGNLNQDETQTLAVSLAKAMENIRYDLADREEAEDDWSE